MPYIKIDAWGPVKESEEIDVSPELYNQVQVDGKIDVFYLRENYKFPGILLKHPRNLGSFTPTLPAF